MPNRQLTSEEQQQLFAPLIAEVRSKLVYLTDGDKELHWALRRKLAKTLTYDERSGPNERRKLKTQKRKEQGGLCPACQGMLPVKYAVLDRYEAMKGYTAENTRLICAQCDTKIQEQRGYA